MRYIYIVFALLMLLFAAVQYNDPDGLTWTMIYSVPMCWSALAAFRRSLLTENILRKLLLLCLAAAVAGAIYYWPDAPRWWSRDVWMEAETAREGMGMMVVSFVLLFVWLTTRRSHGADSS